MPVTVGVLFQGRVAPFAELAIRADARPLDALAQLLEALVAVEQEEELALEGRARLVRRRLDAQPVTEMQRVFPRVQRENLIVEFSGSGLGFVGRGSPVPFVTVKLQNMTYSFVALDGLLGFGPLTMPPFTATAVAEDLG